MNFSLNLENFHVRTISYCRFLLPKVVNRHNKSKEYNHYTYSN